MGPTDTSRPSSSETGDPIQGGAESPEHQENHASSQAKGSQSNREEQGRPTRRDFLALIGHIRPHWRRVALAGLLGLLGNGAALLQPLAAKWMIDTVSSAKGLTFSPVVALTALVIVGSVLAATGAYVLERMAAEVVHDARRRMVLHTLKLRVGAIQRPGEIITRVTADTTLLSKATSRALVDTLNAVLMLLATIALMASLDIVLLGVSGSVLAVVFAIGVLAVPRIARAQREMQASVGDLGSRLERVLGAFRTMKAFGGEKHEARSLDFAADAARNHAVGSAKWSAFSVIAGGLSTQLAFLAVLAIGGIRVADGSLGISTLIAFLLYLFSLSAPIGNLSQGIAELQSGIAAVRRIRELQALPGEKYDGAFCIKPDTPAAVDFENVSFDYGQGQTVLAGLTFKAEPGQTVALVGESGAGKTTVFSLMERFFDLTSGQIRLDGVDISTLSLSSLRSQIAYVEQEAPVFEGTLRENLLYAIAEPVPDDMLKIALQRTNLTDLLDTLPAGIDTPVGHRGITLSGGQRQRIAVARALIRQPRLLLLDEATSQLDAGNEKALVETLREIAGSTTVMIIAHRLSTVVNADKIFLMETGRVRASGTHSELAAHDRVYASLSRAQHLSH